VAKYIEGSGRDMDNPSAYLTFLLTKFAVEGVYDEDESEKHTKKPTHKRKPPQKETPGSSKKFKASSEFRQSGVDMSISEGKPGDITRIFPSAKRGRGRGYM
jgi:hypothetical protein